LPFRAERYNIFRLFDATTEVSIMRGILLLTLATLFTLSSAARADFIYQGRFITIHIKSGKPAEMPVQPDARPKVVLPPPGLPLEVAPPGKPVPTVGSTSQQSQQTVPMSGVVKTPKSATTFTVQEFATFFKPNGGNYRTTLIHPFTSRPVDVAFTLPIGSPKVSYSKELLEYNYGKQAVEIRFERDGQVNVKYLR